MNNRFIKLIEKKKQYRRIYYGSIMHVDKFSWTLYCCDEDCDYIQIKTLSKDDYDSSEIPEDLIKCMFDKCLIERNKKHDSTLFDYEDEKKSLERTSERYKKAFKQQ